MKKISSIALLFAVCGTIGVNLAAGAPSDSTAAIPNNVLIAMGASYLENAVSTIVKDSLGAAGYGVTIINAKNLNRQERRDFAAIILFNAVKSRELTQIARKFVKSIEGSPAESNLLICSVFGERWDNNTQGVNAVASATKTLNPNIMAGKVLAEVRLILGKNKKP
jgi:hypothetical protein